MAVRIEKHWIDLNASNVAKVSGHLGVYQLANKNTEIVYIGVADATSSFGLREKLEGELRKPKYGACQFRLEINMAYRTRYTELLQVFSMTEIDCLSGMRILIQILLADFGRVAVLAKLNPILSFYVRKK